MGATKLKKHGNSYGFTIPSSELKEANFNISDEFEMIVSRNCITFLKRRPHHSDWKFDSVELDSEDQAWLDADLGELEHPGFEDD